MGEVCAASRGPPPLPPHPAQRPEQRPLLNTPVAALRPPLGPIVESRAGACPHPRQVSVTGPRLPPQPSAPPPLPTATRLAFATPALRPPKTNAPSLVRGSGRRAYPPSLFPTPPRRTSRPSPLLFRECQGLQTWGREMVGSLLCCSLALRPVVNANRKATRARGTTTKAFSIHGSAVPYPATAPKGSERKT